MERAEVTLSKIPYATVGLKDNLNLFKYNQCCANSGASNAWPQATVAKEIDEFGDQILRDSNVTIDIKSQPYPRVDTNYNKKQFGQVAPAFLKVEIGGLTSDSNAYETNLGDLNGIHYAFLWNGFNNGENTQWFAPLCNQTRITSIGRLFGVLLYFSMDTDAASSLTDKEVFLNAQVIFHNGSSIGVGGFGGQASCLHKKALVGTINFGSHDSSGFNFDFSYPYNSTVDMLNWIDVELTEDGTEDEEYIESLLNGYCDISSMTIKVSTVPADTDLTKKFKTNGQGQTVNTCYNYAGFGDTPYTVSSLAFRPPNGIVTYEDSLMSDNITSYRVNTNAAFTKVVVAGVQNKNCTNCEALNQTYNLNSVFGTRISLFNTAEPYAQKYKHQNTISPIWHYTDPIPCHSTVECSGYLLSNIYAPGGSGLSLVTDIYQAGFSSYPIRIDYTQSTVNSPLTDSVLELTYNFSETTIAGLSPAADYLCDFTNSTVTIYNEFETEYQQGCLSIYTKCHYCNNRGYGIPENLLLEIPAFSSLDVYIPRSFPAVSVVLSKNCDVTNDPHSILRFSDPSCQWLYMDDDIEAILYIYQTDIDPGVGYDNRTYIYLEVRYLSVSSSFALSLSNNPYDITSLALGTIDYATTIENLGTNEEYNYFDCSTLFNSGFTFSMEHDLGTVDATISVI
jgi:hypothetical protein